MRDVIDPKRRSYVLNLRYILAALAIITGSHSYAKSEYRTFKNSDGVTIEAKIFDAIDGKSVSIQLKDGKRFKNVPLDRFSKKDRDYIAKWCKQQKEAIDNAQVTEDSRIKLTVLTGRDKDFNDYGDIDDQVISIQPQVVVENQDYDKTFRDVKGVIIMIGRGKVQDSAYVILKKEQFTITVEPRSNTRWRGKRFSLRYDPDYGGYEYEGYLVALYDRSGKNPVIVKSSKSAWERSADAILKAKAKKGYDRNFTYEKSLHTTWGLP